MTVTINGTTGIQNVLGSASAPADANTTSTNTGVYYPTSVTWGVATAGTNALYIDASQNVGIGTTSPSAKLDVVGNIKSNNYVIYSGSASYALNLSGGTAFNTGGSSIALRGISNGYNNGGMEFYTGSGATGAEVMRIDSSGNVGIGTTSPSNKFAVATSTQYKGIAVNNGTNDIVQIIGQASGNDNGSVILLNSGTAGAYIQANGNSYLNGGKVGIGTTSPQRTLDINGEIRATGSQYFGGSVGAVRATNFWSSEYSFQYSTSNTIYFNFSDNAGSNGTTYGLIIRGLGSSGSAQVLLSSFSALASSVFNGANTTTWNTSSDSRIKKNIVSNNVGLEKITQIKVRNFEYRKADEITELPKEAAVQVEGVQLGVIAQELQSILPECVFEQANGVLSLKTDNLIWHLVNAVQELSAEITALKAKVGA
jgi:Chaperone of endosialidase